MEDKHVGSSNTLNVFCFGMVREKYPYRSFYFCRWWFSTIIFKRLMNVNVRIFCVLGLGIIFNSCSPEYRLRRILKNNPTLYEIFTHDSIHIRDVVVQDSVFFFTKEKDTIRFENATIYRTHDTIRLRQSCPPCTTLIQQQILRPSKETIKEKGIKRSFREKLEDAIFPFIMGFLLALLIRRK